MIKASLTLLLAVGAFAVFGSATRAGAAGSTGAASSVGCFLYFNQGPFVDGFLIPPNGALPTRVPGAPYPTGGAAPILSFTTDNIVVSPGGILYVPNGEGATVAAFSINPSTGELTAVPGSPFKINGVRPDDVAAAAVTPDDRFLYVALSSNEVVAPFSIGSDGSLSQLAGPPGPLGFLGNEAISPDGKVLAVGLPGDEGLQTFAIGPNGSLTRAPGSPYFPPVDASFFSICISNNNLLISAESDQASAFSIAPNGQLTLAPSLVFGGDVPSSMGVLTPDGRFLYQLEPMLNFVAGFAVSPDGNATPLPGSPFGFAPVGTDTGPIGLAFSSDLTRLMVLNASGALNVFDISESGVPIEEGSSPFLGPFGGTGMAVFPLPHQKGAIPTSYDACVSNAMTHDMFEFDSTTGDYRYVNCKTGLCMVGRGTLTKDSCRVMVTDDQFDRKVSAGIDKCKHTGSAIVTSSFLKLNLSFSSSASAQCGCKGL